VRRLLLLIGLATFPFVAAACTQVRTSSSPTAPTGNTTCTYAVSTSTFSMAGQGGTATIAVNTGSSCAWTVSSNASFINITSANSQSGSGTVTFVVAPNTGDARNATLSVAGQSITIAQGAGSAADPVLGNWSGTIVKGAGCPAVLPASVSWTGTVRRGSAGNTELVVSIPQAGVVNQAVAVTLTGNEFRFGVPLDTNYTFVGTLSSDRRSVTGTFTGAACSGTWNASHQ
jgi:hypothetical protein